MERLSPSRWLALAASPQAPLGGLGYGLKNAAGETEPASVPALALSPQGAVVDAWCSSAPQRQSGRYAATRWHHDGHWLFGALERDEAGEGGDLAALTERAYGDVFASLGRTGFPHLLRVWNYLPDINADCHGMERYRLFNAGRQQAFLKAGRSAFEGAPAACAIGTRDGPLCVRFLAGRTPAVPLENPRQVSAYDYPSQYGPRSPSFSRAALVDAGAGRVALLISGTSSIVGHGSVHVGDARAQTREALANLQAVLDVAGTRSSARFELPALECTVYVRHAEHLPLIRAELESAVGALSQAARTAVYLQGDICRGDLSVEIEAHAFAPGEVLA